MNISKSNCHTGNPLVFETSDGVRFYAGGNTRNGGWMQMKPRPELAIGPQGVIRVARTFDVIPDGFTCVNDVQAIDIPHIIELEWPDFSTPSNVGREFWLSLVDDIKTKGIKSVSCQCMGGHGRTGVQLAIFAHFMIEKKNQTWKDAGELIQWVRDSYCTHAVEAKSQQEYISTVCQMPYGVDKISLYMDSADDFSFKELTNVDFDLDMIDKEIEGNGKTTKKKQVGKKYWQKSSLSAEQEMSLDDEHYSENCTEECDISGLRFHPLEMFDGISKHCFIAEFNLDVKTRGLEKIRWQDKQFKCEVTNRWWPLVYSEFTLDAFDSEGYQTIRVISIEGKNKKLPSKKKGKKSKAKKITDYGSEKK